MTGTHFPSNLLQYSSEPSRNRNGSRIVFSSSSSRRQKNPKCVTTPLAGITILFRRPASASLQVPPPVSLPVPIPAPLQAPISASLRTLIPTPLEDNTSLLADFPAPDKSRSGSTVKWNASRGHSRCSGSRLLFWGKKFCPRTTPVRRAEIHTTRNIFFRCMVLLSFLCRFTA